MIDPDEDKRRILTDIHDDQEVTPGMIIIGVVLYCSVLLWAAWSVWGG